MPDPYTPAATTATPAYNFQPTGYLAGALYAHDLARSQANQPLQDQMLANQAQTSNINLQDLTATHEGEVAATNAANLAKTQTAGPLAQAAADKATADAKYRSATVDADIATHLSAAALQKGQAGMDLLQQEQDKVQQVLSQATQAPGPHSRAQMEQALTKAGIDSNSDTAQMFLNTDPQHWPEIANRMHSIYDQAKTQTRNALDIQGMKSATSMDVARTEAASRENVARMQLEAKQKQISNVWLNAINDKSPNRDANILVTGQSLLAQPDLDPNLRAQIVAAMRQANQNLIAKRSATPQIDINRLLGQPDYQGAPNLPPNFGAAPGAPAAAPAGGPAAVPANRPPLGSFNR